MQAWQLRGSVKRAPDDGLPIQQVVALTGMSEYNLRFYERVGLLRPVRRDRSSGHRRYSPADISRVRTLACLRAIGMSLEQMRHYFELVAQGASAAPALQALLHAQRHEQQLRMQLLLRHMEFLDRKIAYWRAVEEQDEALAMDIARELSEDVRTETTRG